MLMKAFLTISRNVIFFLISRAFIKSDAIHAIAPDLTKGVELWPSSQT